MTKSTKNFVTMIHKKRRQLYVHNYVCYKHQKTVKQHVYIICCLVRFFSEMGVVASWLSCPGRFFAVR